MTPDPVPLLCLPYAGAGASLFHAWQPQVPPGIRLAPLQLPGREERTDEEPFRDAASAVRALLPEAVAAAAGHRRVAVLGHSMGAVLAFELVRALEERTEIPVAHLYVSGSPGPCHGRAESTADLDDEAFLAAVERLAGYRHAAFDVPELRELLLPLLRADVALHETYRPLADAPVEAPLTCLRGDLDSLVTAEDAAQWSRATTGPFTYREPSGGHMYLLDSPGELLRLVAADLHPGAPAAAGVLPAGDGPAGREVP
ncbi:MULTISPECIES: thioesterase II family protein [Streptomyces]|uniref:Alpha/beta fold hydrolase n=1 Tax=Streptomyces sudanensis TaxID=436397 RepID=A0ABY4T6I6_9ACTN|nr:MULTISPECIES: alpha/beta fold hydrolase [Streptomyces]MCP9956152.1 alpha/beta fold hydrolase [Streptomyces sudanensis]MCP9985353.1 alpha/beta fold hydrolase [Streptomyces sudanensis]MCQ0003211.1 alpha/beta fold hydrolase [Streptomyces sudanensis]URN14583.1 alpha/beta fold hydrolase [Streptomyces sudanensis]